MSILSAAPTVIPASNPALPTSNPAEDPAALVELLILAFFTVLAIVLAGRFGVFRRNGLESLGFGLRKLKSGVLAGIVGFLVITPVVFWTLALTEIVLKRIHYTHPTDHPLLKALAEAPNVWVRRLLIIGGTVCAPFY